MFNISYHLSSIFIKYFKFQSFSNVSDQKTFCLNRHHKFKNTWTCFSHTQQPITTIELQQLWYKSKKKKWKTSRKRKKKIEKQLKNSHYQIVVHKRRHVRRHSQIFLTFFLHFLFFLRFFVSTLTKLSDGFGVPLFILSLTYSTHNIDNNKKEIYIYIYLYICNKNNIHDSNNEQAEEENWLILIKTTRTINQQQQENCYNN